VGNIAGILILLRLTGMGLGLFLLDFVSQTKLGNYIA